MPIPKDLHDLIQTHKLIAIVIGKTEIDVRYIEHIIEEGQLEIYGWIMKKVKDKQKRKGTKISVVREILEEIESSGLDSITPYNSGKLALPRYQDVLAAMNRLR